MLQYLCKITVVLARIKLDLINGCRVAKSTQNFFLYFVDPVGKTAYLVDV